MPSKQVYRAPFPWFGGKSRVADAIWARLGADVDNYVEPFFGSGAVLLSRPNGAGKVETVNDADGYICNFWRAVQHDPEAVARYADYPVNENDLHARHVWLRQFRHELPARLEGDPDYYDAKVAGWWVWGINLWIGSGWCSDAGKGPWFVENGMLISAKECRKRPSDIESKHIAARMVSRMVPHLCGNGRGVHAAKCREMGGARRKIPNLRGAGGGIHGWRCRSVESTSHRTEPCENGGTGGCGIYRWMDALSERLRYVRVCCGDFERVLAATPTVLQNGTTGILLDPPYDVSQVQQSAMYARYEDDVSKRAAAWAIAHGDNPRLRIALCGYEGEHDMPDTWECFEWKANGGFGNQRKASAKNANRFRERIWFSPHCLKPTADDLPRLVEP